MCPKHPSRTQQENIPAAPSAASNTADDTDTNGLAAAADGSRQSTAPTVFDTLFATPSYWRNARVATLEMIVQERSGAQSASSRPDVPHDRAAVGPNAAVNTHEDPAHK